ncbi:MAG: class I SAM-dependent methyltransferase [Planctomycetaceae bacterium]|nr:class I SAM-dependent methyltransferase [Planctomycetaceae bacterium]MBV8312927.1 class I SAM-dependent methyltransferase [Planctomycetaceae bacterium]
MSSSTGDSAALEDLDRRMAAFYGESARRYRYQAMLDTREDHPITSDSVASGLLDLIVGSGAGTVLEVGCGNGWLYRKLREKGFGGIYHGVEVARYMIDRNATRHPDAHWSCGTAYEIGLPDGAVDTCFAFYVVEHLVYPERGLREMLRVVRPGRDLILVFPDFAAVGHLASQQTGFSPGRASAKLRRGRLFDAAVSLFDSRCRVRSMLRVARKKVGPFPVNIRPLCLTHPGVIESDVDAVYVASRHEVADWAQDQGLRVEYPFGTEALYHSNAVVRITK